jgi:hypothetical protein
MTPGSARRERVAELIDSDQFQRAEIAAVREGGIQLSQQAGSGNGARGT